MKVSKPPTPQETNGAKIDLTGGLVPIVYLGHHQRFVFTCGVFGEQTMSPTMTGSDATCP
jgi:hypothetical protein